MNTLLLTAAFLCGLVQLRTPSLGEGAMSFRIQESPFKEDGVIPREYTCDGEDSSPALTWAGIPGKTRSLALICDDPDAPGGNWVHWVVYDLPADTRQLPGALAPQAEISGGGRQGTNSFGKIGYGGPCPPAGPAHRYYFRLFALDKPLGLAPGATREEVLAAAEGHILGKTEIFARYARSKS